MASRQFAIIGAVANCGAAQPGPSRSQGGTALDAVRAAFPEHTRKLVASIVGLSAGATKKKLEGDRPFKADELAAMLRTERGFELLTAVMADAKPAWWVLCSAFMEVRTAQRLQAKARRRIARAVRSTLNADADLTAAIARAELFSDEEFHRPHADALRSMAGIPDRPLAQTKGRGR